MSTLKRLRQENKIRVGGSSCPPRFTVDVWHNILWSRYKGAVFSALHREAICKNVHIRFFQIAETENDRSGLSNVDLNYHKYPFTLIGKGSYEEIQKTWLSWTLFKKALMSDADVIVIAGYYRVEYWTQLFGALLGQRKSW